MGLDMYLRGEKYLWGDWEHPENDLKEDGFKVNTITLELGYWRKHPDLHGYIVEAFAEGRDTCQRIDLTAEDMRRIIETIKSGKLPTTSGFFFGTSSNDKAEREHAIGIFEAAIRWLENSDVAPASLGEPVNLGGGFAMHVVKPDTTAETMEQLGGAKQKQGPRDLRSVYYQASW